MLAETSKTKHFGREKFGRSALTHFFDAKQVGESFWEKGYKTKTHMEQT